MDVGGAWKFSVSNRSLMLVIPLCGSVGVIAHLEFLAVSPP